MSLRRWFDEDGEVLYVATTDRQREGEIRAAGATPKVVDRSYAELTAMTDRLLATERPAELAVWSIDPIHNRIVVEAYRGGRRAAEAFVAEAGLDRAAVSYATTTARPEPAIDLVLGGSGYRGEKGGGCSAGFAVRPRGNPFQTGFLTAGHCGGVNDRALRPGGTTEIGIVASSDFGQNMPDRGYVVLTGGSQSLPFVKRYKSGPPQPVLGVARPSINDPVCNSGASTGWQCGIITSDRTGHLIGGVFVADAVRTDTCSTPGDSSGPVVVLFQAVGIGVGSTSIQGPRMTCRTLVGPRQSFFQPIDRILSDVGLELLAPESPAGPADDPEPPVLAGLFCFPYDADGTTFACDVDWEGGADPETVVWSFDRGTFEGLSDTVANHSRLSGQCTPGGYAETVKVTVTDDLGRTITARAPARAEDY